MELFIESLRSSIDQVHPTNYLPSTTRSNEPTSPRDGSAPARPLTIDEAAIYTSTRQLPPRIQQTSDNSTTRLIDPSHLTSSNTIITLHPHMTRPRIKASTTKPKITQPSHGPQSTDLLAAPPSSLPNPTPPPPLSKSHLLSLPPTHRETLANQRAYAWIFNSLERDGGWLWWEKTFVDVEKVERDFGGLCDETGGGDTVMVGSDSGSGNQNGNGDVLGEEEEEVPEHERVRTENNKRIAAYVTRCLRLGIVE